MNVAESTRSWFAIWIVSLASCGCVTDSYKYVKEVGRRGTVQIIEDGQRRQYERVVVDFRAYWRDYLAPTVPALEDEPAVRRLIHDTPVERHPTNLMVASKAVGYHAEGYPWHGRLHWIIESDPLVIAIGGPQGREAAERGGERGSQYPLVGSTDLGEQVTHLIVFQDGVKRLRARDPKDAAKAPREVVTLPTPMSLDEVLDTRVRAGR